MSQPVYCPRCGAAMQQKIVDDRERDVCPVCGYIFYRNPVPAVGVVVALDGKVVLVRRRYEPRAGCWALPAGFMELGESAEEAAIRECHEETSLLVRVDHLLDVYSFGTGAQTGLLIVYAATATGGELVAADDATEAGVFAPDALPSPMAFRSHIQAIDRWRRENTRRAGVLALEQAGSAVQIRFAEAADIPSILSVLLDPADVNNEQAVVAEALLYDRSNDIDKPILLAEQDGVLHGVALLAFHQTPRGWHATLDELVVDVGMRRQGIGRALVESAAQLARARGCDVLQAALPVLHEEAHAFLHACGLIDTMPARRL